MVTIILVSGETKLDKSIRIQGKEFQRFESSLKDMVTLFDLLVL